MTTGVRRRHGHAVHWCMYPLRLLTPTLRHYALQCCNCLAAAHRPTIVPAKGHEEQGGMRIFVPSRMQSAKDMAAHTKLKFR